MLNPDLLRNAAILIEEQFSCGRYNGLDFSLRPFAIKLGQGNIVISAPHSVNHIRNNRVKHADMHTGSIAQIVQMATNCFSIFSTRISEEDPNYVIGGRYKEALRDLCARYPIDLVIDIHGASPDRDFDIDLGTLNGESVDGESLEIIRKIFHKNGIKNVTTDSVFKASHPGTITYFAKNTLKIRAVQMEINRSFRDPRSNIAGYAAIIQSLIEIVGTFKKGHA